MLNENVVLSGEEPQQVAPSYAHATLFYQVSRVTARDEVGFEFGVAMENAVRGLRATKPEAPSHAFIKLKNFQLR